MKANELKDLTIEELRSKEKEIQETLFNLQISTCHGSAGKYHAYSDDQKGFGPDKNRHSSQDGRLIKKPKGFKIWKRGAVKRP